MKSKRFTPSSKNFYRLIDNLNVFFNHWDKHYPSPILWDIDKVCPELRILEENYSVIREEVDALLTDRERIPLYNEVSPYIPSATATPGRWQVFMLRGWKYDFKANQAICPKTSALIKKIPKVYLAFFSILDPFKYIERHRGDYKGYIRYHLGIRIPQNPTPHLLVQDKTIYWEEGKSFLFDDFHHHEAFNDNRKARIVLIVDIERPRPFIPRVVNRFFLNTIGRQFFLKRLLGPNAGLKL